MTAELGKKQGLLFERDVRDRIKERLKITFANDYLNNSKRLISERTNFASVHKTFSAMGHVSLYIGTGISTASAALQLLNLKSLSNIFLFTSTAFFALSIVMVGIAKFSHSREGQRSAQLDACKQDVGFRMNQQGNEKKGDEKKNAEKKEDVKQIIEMQLLKKNKQKIQDC